MIGGAHTSPAGNKASLKNFNVFHIMEIDFAVKMAHMHSTVIIKKWKSNLLNET